MNTSLQFRAPEEVFEAHRTLALESETSMSALFTEGMNKVANDPDKLAKVIRMFLEEAGLGNGKAKK